MEITVDAKMLYALLCDFAGDKDHCWPSQTRLAGMLSCSVSSVKKYLRELEARDLISIRRGSFHASTYYILRPKNAALFSRPQEPKIAYPQANSGYDPYPPGRLRAHPGRLGRTSAFGAGAGFLPPIRILKRCGRPIRARKPRKPHAPSGISSGGAAAFRGKPS